MFNEELQELIEKALEIDEKDSIFKTSFFKDGVSTGNIAYLNWRFGYNSMSEQFMNMGDAYFESQYNNFQTMLFSNHNVADGWIFPTIFATVHGIECYLKGFYGEFGIILEIVKGEKPTKIETRNGHNIKNLCHEVIARLKKIREYDDNYTWKNAAKEMQLVLVFIDFLYEKTNDVANFRYPFDTKFQEVFYNQEFDHFNYFNQDNVEKQGNENITLDIADYFVWFVRVHNVLKNISYSLDDARDAYSE